MLSRFDVQIIIRDFNAKNGREKINSNIVGQEYIHKETTLQRQIEIYYDET